MQNFEELSHSIFRDYVRSAVIIDDHWPDVGKDDSLQRDLDDDQVIADAAEFEDDEGDILEDLELSGEAVVPSHRQKSEARADAALLGELHKALLKEQVITCGVRYEKRHHDTAIGLARRSDIVVLDWHLIGDDEGRQALNVLETLMEDGALRFICIYTGQGRVQEVHRALTERWLPEKIDVKDDSLGNIRIKNLVIAIRIKLGIEQDLPEYTVAPDKFFDHAVDGLTQEFGGLVQLALLEMTCHHRRHVPEILEHVGKDTDLAVFFEGATEKSPVGPGGAFLSVLVDEWRSRLERDHEQFGVLGVEGRIAYGKRIADSAGSDFIDTLSKVLNPKEAKKFTLSDLQGWLRSGQVERLPEAPSSDINADRSTLASWDLLSAHAGARSPEEGSTIRPVDSPLSLDAMFHQQFDPPKRLTQGTVVSVSGNVAKEYLVCTTPLCDADEPGKVGGLFTFVRASVVPAESGLTRKGKPMTHYCVIRDAKKYICLEVLIKERLSLEVHETAFDVNGEIVTRFSLGRSFANDTSSTSQELCSDRSNVVILRRVAQLRLDHALAMSAASAADATRVGVNRVELIRKFYRR